MQSAFEKRPWLLPLILAVLTVLYLKPLIVPLTADSGLDSHDMLSMNYPLQELISKTVHSGQLPLWNPNEFIGHPISSNPQSALFYPVTWFLWVVGVVRGINLAMAFHAWLGAWGMAVLMRRFHASYVGSLLAGVIYSMSGLAAARFYAGHYVQFMTLSWIPWIIAAYHYALTHRTWRSVLPGIGALGIALLVGHTQILMYGGICLVVLWAYYIGSADDVLRAAWTASRLLVVMVIGGAILGAALVLPTLELAKSSVRSGTGTTFANTFAMPAPQLLSFALPGLFGDPKAPPSYTHYWGADFYEEFNAYAGLLPLLAIPLAFRWLRRDNWYFMALVVLGLVMSIGLEGALMPLFWNWIPGFTSFRGPSHSLILMVIGLAGLTAMLITALENSTVEERREALRPAVRLWLPIGTAACFAGAIFFAGWFASASHVEPMPQRALVISGALVEAGIILLGIWLALWLWQDNNNKALRWALPLTCLVVLLDAWHIGFQIITVNPIRDDVMWVGATNTIPAGADARLIAPFDRVNTHVDGYLNVNGYDPLVLDTYDKLQALNDVHDPTTPINMLLGVKYLIATQPYEKPNFTLIGITEGNIYYRREDTFPRTWIASKLVVEANDDAVRAQIAAGKQNMQETAYIDHAVDCPTVGGTASIADYKADLVEIKTSGNGGLLVLSDQYYPGWQATLDGQTVPIVRTDTLFRGVCVPAGDHTVRFDYRPQPLMIGLALSVLGWLAWAVLMILSRVNRK